MRVLITSLALLTLALLTGCPDDDTGNPDDTGDTGVEASARIAVTPMFLGNAVECDIGLKKGSATIFGASGEPIEVSPNTYNLLVGDRNPDTHTPGEWEEVTKDGLPLILVDDDVHLVMPPESITLVKDDEVDREVEMNQYFHIENAVCENMAGPGDTFFPGEVWVEDGYRVRGLESRLLGNSWIEVKGDHLVLLGEDATLYGATWPESTLTAKKIFYRTCSDDAICSSYECRER